MHIAFTIMMEIIKYFRKAATHFPPGAGGILIGRGPTTHSHNLAAASYTERFNATLVLAKPVPQRRSPPPHLAHFRCTQKFFTTIIAHRFFAHSSYIE